MNKFLFKWHSRLALLAFIPLLVICVTGAILVFKHELDILLMDDKVRVKAVGEQRLPLDDLRDRVHEEVPDHEIIGWSLFQDRGRADLVYVMEHGTSDWSYVLLNQYNGELLAQPRELTHYFTDWLLELHFNLLLDETGMAITLVFAVIFCLLGISGLIMHRHFWGSLFRIRRRARVVVYFSDLHKTVGALASPILLILGFTGAWWNATELIHHYREHGDGSKHHVMEDRLYNDELSLDTLMRRAGERIEGFETTYISMPYEPELPIIFYGGMPDSNFLISQFASHVTFDADNGERVAEQDIRKAGLGAKIVGSYRRLHFGDFAGLPSRILWSVVGLMPLILALTGVTLWFLRRDKKRRAARNKQLRMAGNSGD